MSQKNNEKEEPWFYIKTHPSFEIFFKGKIITTETFLQLLFYPQDNNIKKEIPKPTAPLAADAKNEWLIPRYKVIADFPKSIFKVGTIIKTDKINEDLIYCDTDGARMRDYPAIFKKMEWWEDRTPEEWATLKKVKVIRYVGYWREGDIVDVERFYFAFPGYKETGRYGVLLKFNHFQTFDTVEPA